MSGDDTRKETVDALLKEGAGHEEEGNYLTRNCIRQTLGECCGMPEDEENAYE